MRKTLPSEMEYVFRGVIRRRCPSLDDVPERISLGVLSAAEKKSVLDALSEEFCEAGLDNDDEPTGYGLLIEEIIDFVSRSA